MTKIYILLFISLWWWPSRRSSLSSVISVTDNGNPQQLLHYGDGGREELVDNGRGISRVSSDKRER